MRSTLSFSRGLRLPLPINWSFQFGTTLLISPGKGVQLLSPERILLLFPATLAPGPPNVQVINPPGDTSNEVSFTLAGEK